MTGQIRSEIQTHNMVLNNRLSEVSDSFIKI